MEMQGGNAIAEKMVAMMNSGRVEMMDEIYSPDLKSHTAPEGMAGLEFEKAMARIFFGAFSDMSWEMGDVMSQGDKVMLHFDGHGKHTGDFMGTAPTNKHVCMGGMMVARVKDGKIVESWEYFDAMGLMMQLGAMPDMRTQLGAMGEQERRAA